MTPILEALYREYSDLKQKLSKLADLILSYGGSIPYDIDPKDVISVFPESSVYPFSGSWKQKILFALEHCRRPVTVRELTGVIVSEENGVKEEERKKLSIDKPDSDHILKMVTQYASTMGKNKEIGVDNTDHRNKYFIQK